MGREFRRSSLAKSNEFYGTAVFFSFISHTAQLLSCQSYHIPALPIIQPTFPFKPGFLSYFIQGHTTVAMKYLYRVSLSKAPCFFLTFSQLIFRDSLLLHSHFPSIIKRKHCESSCCNECTSQPGFVTSKTSYHVIITVSQSDCSVSLTTPRKSMVPILAPRILIILCGIGSSYL